MPLARRASLNFDNMNLGVSYRINEEGSFLQDASNVCSNQGRLETRRGTSRYNAVELASNPLSLSYYQAPSATKYVLAKCGTVLYSASILAAHTSVKTGLGATTKHRAVTINGRHIIACGGLYSFNGTTFTQLGQDVPAVPNSSASATGGTLPTATYYTAYSFYASSIGFETNLSAYDTVAITLGEKITFGAAVPSSADNALIDKVRVYLRSGSGSFLFVEEVALGATPANITAVPTSTQVAPTTHALPPTTAKYLASYNSRLVVAGITNYESDVYISEEDLPDAFDDAEGVKLYANGQGAITGIATGFFNNSVLEPYLVIFKKRQTYVYAELSGQSRMSEIDASIGCISADSIQVINGNVYFMSESGFRVIIDGKIATIKGRPVTLANGAIDDIFNSSEYAYKINKSNSENFHGVYSGREKRYLTFVSELTSTDKRKAYVYELESGGFKPYNFQYNINCSCMAEDNNSDEIALFGTDNGFILKHSDSELRNDTDLQGNSIEIPAFALFSWIRGRDLDSTYNFRQLVVTGLISSNNVTCKGWVNYQFSNLTSDSIDLSDDENSFTLDVSQLDVGILGTGRSPTSASVDINRRGKNLCVGFYQSTLGANLGIINMQLDFSKNGNRN